MTESWSTGMCAVGGGGRRSEIIECDELQEPMEDKLADRPAWRIRRKTKHARWKKYKGHVGTEGGG